MAKLFDIYKTFRPRTTILSDDFNSFQAALSAAFAKLGTEPPVGKYGVSTAFYCADPTEAQHSVTKAYLEGQIDALVAGALVSETAAAQQSADDAEVSNLASAASAAAALVTQSNTAALRLSDAYYLTFFFGHS